MEEATNVLFSIGPLEVTSTVTTMWAIIAVLGAASVCSRSEHRLRFLKLFADTPLRKGKRRYYDNCLYFFCLLMLTGHYRIYI